MKRLYPYIADPPAQGRPYYVCAEGHRTRWDGLHDETACTAEIRHRRCCNRRAVKVEVPMAS